MNPRRRRSLVPARAGDLRDSRSLLATGLRMVPVALKARERGTLASHGAAIPMVTTTESQHE